MQEQPTHTRRGWITLILSFPLIASAAFLGSIFLTRLGNSNGPEARGPQLLTGVIYALVALAGIYGSVDFVKSGSTRWLRRANLGWLLGLVPLVVLVSIGLSGMAP